MALVSYILTPEGFDENYWKTLKPTSAFLYPRVSKNTRFLSRKQKLALKDRSLFTWFAEYWRELTDDEKNDWKEAAAEIGLTNWQLFVHDTAARWAYQYPDFSTPNTLHQGRVGWIQIDEPDDEIKITQLHPKFYWVKRLAAGHKRFFVPVKVTEDFALPLKIEISYYADLEVVGENPFAKFYAEVWRSYQGVDYKTELKIDFDFQPVEATYGEGIFGRSRYGQEEAAPGWRRAEATLSQAAGQIIHYDIFIHLKGLRGTLYFDNVEAEHSAQNWARDPRCDEIEKVHPRTWFLIPKNWVGVTVPDNSFYQSTFVDF